MKKILQLIICISAFVMNAFAQHPPAEYFHLISIADSLQRANNFPEAASVYNKAFFAFKGKGFVNDRYKAACAYARAGKTDSSYYHLFRIADKGGWSEYDFLVSDSDLFVLHSDPRWSKLVNKVRQNKAEVESHLNKPMADELEKIFDDDQKYRMLIDSAEKISGKNSPQMDSLKKIIASQDVKNLSRVTEMIETYGWLGTDDVGRKGNQALFLVLQHSDLATRKKYLPVMREAMERNKAAPTEYALFEDRLLVDEGKEQLYGSQVKFNAGTGSYELYPIEDEANVNVRREEIGLPRLEDYLRQWGIHYNSKK
jgi:hypothetical protein